MWESAQWIRIPPDELKQKQIYHGDLGGRFAYFRCEQALPDKYRRALCPKPLLIRPAYIWQRPWSKAGYSIVYRRANRRIGYGCGHPQTGEHAWL